MRKSDFDEACFLPLQWPEKQSDAMIANGIEQLPNIERSHLQRFWSKRWSRVGTIVLLIVILLAIVVPVCSPYTYDALNSLEQNQGVSFAHWFGTDKFGRDLFLRTWLGARTTLFVAGISTGINLVFGVLYGGLAGYLGGVLDNILMRIADVVYSIPTMVYVILCTTFFGPSVGTMIVGLCISSWVALARMMRAQTMHIKEKEYVLASKTMGSSGAYIFFQDVLRNSAGPVLIQAMLLIPQAIFMEAFLSFLGVGFVAPMTSWGTLLQEGIAQFLVYPSQMIFPLLLLVLTIVSINWVGEGLDYAFNPNPSWKEYYESI